jgi:hypothetical protein
MDVSDLSDMSFPFSSDLIICHIPNYTTGGAYM